MQGLGALFRRDTTYTATNTTSGVSQTFTVLSDLAPDWSSGAYQGGMGVPGAWRAASMRAGLLGGLPWHAYRERGGRPAERIFPTPPLLDLPNPEETRVSTLTSMALDLIWEGNAVALIAARDRAGWPTAVLPVPARDVAVRRAEPWDATDLPVGALTYRYGRRVFPASDVIHVKGMCAPGALRGMGVLEAHLNGAVKLAADLDRQAGEVSRHGVPTGLLKSSDPDMEQGDADALKKAWMAAQASRTIAVLNETTDFTPLAWTPEETQLIEARTYSLHTLALVFGLPPYWLGVDAGSRTYSNAEMESLNLLKFSALADDLARFEQTFTMHMPRGTWAKANLDSLLRSDTLTRYQTHEIGIRTGVLTDDEARAIEDRPPLTPAQRAARAPAATPPAAGQGPNDNPTDAEEAS